MCLVVLVFAFLGEKGLLMPCMHQYHFQEDEKTVSVPCGIFDNIPCSLISQLL